MAMAIVVGKVLPSSSSACGRTTRVLKRATGCRWTYGGNWVASWRRSVTPLYALTTPIDIDACFYHAL